MRCCASRKSTCNNSTITSQANGNSGCVGLCAEANLISKFGKFKIYVFSDSSGCEHAALVNGLVSGKEDVPLRVHSECLTGNVFASLRCDCREQLERSLKHISSKKNGILIYLRQEGRGIGLVNKIRAYHLQENGLDTVEANEALGLPADAREYSLAADILKALTVKSVILLTNNPKKVEALKKQGIIVSKVLPLVVKANTYNKRYLETKKKKLGHKL